MRKLIRKREKSERHKKVLTHKSLDKKGNRDDIKTEDVENMLSVFL